jgi:hypothetical protein
MHASASARLAPILILRECHASSRRNLGSASRAPGGTRTRRHRKPPNTAFECILTGHLGGQSLVKPLKTSQIAGLNDDLKRSHKRSTRRYRRSCAFLFSLPHFSELFFICAHKTVNGYSSRKTKAKDLEERCGNPLLLFCSALLGCLAVLRAQRKAADCLGSVFAVPDGTISRVSSSHR